MGLTIDWYGCSGGGCDGCGCGGGCDENEENWYHHCLSQLWVLVLLLVVVMMTEMKMNYCDWYDGGCGGCGGCGGDENEDDLEHQCPSQVLQLSG